MPQPDYYKILGVEPHAGLKEIKRAYRRMVLLYHPDKVQGKEKEFREMQQAYDVLTDSVKKKKYDNSRQHTYTPAGPPFSRYHPKIFSILTNTKEFFPGIPFQLYIRIIGNFHSLGIRGLHYFELNGQPQVNETETEYEGQMLRHTVITYSLVPLYKDVVTLGPASVNIDGQVWFSNSVHVNTKPKIDDVAVQQKRGIISKLFDDPRWMTAGVVGSLAIFVSGMLFLDRILPNDSKAEFQNTYETQRLIPENFEKVNPSTGSSPYADVFLPVYDESSGHSLKMINSRFTDAVVMLVETQTERVIRNVFVKAGDTYEMQMIPDGSYFIRVIYGNQWNADLIAVSDLQGGFAADLRLSEYSSVEDQMSFHRVKINTTTGFTNLEVNISPPDDSK